MEKLDGIAIITFIACDAILENVNEIRYFYQYYYQNIKIEAVDIIKKLFR